MSIQHWVAQASELAEKLLQAADERRSKPVDHLFPIRSYPRSSAAIDLDAHKTISHFPVAFPLKKMHHER
jgi:hypothetical protein